MYYLFLWDPYKNTGQPPTQIPHAQANSPPTPSPSSTTTPTSPVISNSPSNTLSDSALDNIVEDLNNGAQPKALAMAMRVLSQKESIRNERHLHTNPYKYLSKGKVVKVLKGSLGLISSPSPLVKIQIMGGKVCLRYKGKTLLGIVNKHLKTKSLLKSLSNVLPYYPSKLSRL